MKRCPGEDALIAFVERGASDRDLAAHVASCPECGKATAQLRTLFESLSDPESWKAHPEFHPSRRRIAELVEFSSRLESGHIEAAARLKKILDQPGESWKREVHTDPSFAHPATVSELLAFARRNFTVDPARSLSACDLALEMIPKATAHGWNPIVADTLVGQSWKERANALRLLDRYLEALESFDRAEEAWLRTPASDFHIAIVDLGRATVFLAIDRIHGAAELARRSLETFRRYGDESRAAQARLMLADCRFKEGNLSAARDGFLELIADARRRNDLAILPLLLNNFAHCEEQLGRPEAAAGAFLEAIPLLEEMGLHSEKLRVDWGLARLRMATGHVDEALALLERTGEEFERLGLVSDAGLVTLDRVEISLSTGRNLDLVPICRELVDLFSRIGQLRNATTACSYLREAAEAGKATPHLVRHVRTYLERLPRQPELLFAPPPPEG
ncbi:MAG: tetratricopeptide repeat protein [Thermoanaerobaculia bacterium]